MAMDSLASVAHAAGFAMVPEDDVLSVEQKSLTPRIAESRTVVLSENSARWQGSAQPVGEINDAARSNGIFDWMPSFNWRADGR